jgi:lysophospholipase L1-like esterase
MKLSSHREIFYFRRMKKICRLFFLAASFVLAGADSWAQTAVNTAIIPATHSQPANWLARHQDFLREAKHDRMDLLFIGDSITDCWRWNAPRYGINVWNKYYRPLHAADFGITGDLTQHVIWRIDHGELDGLHPKVIVLLIGTNNTGDNTPEQIAAAIKVILDKIRAKCPSSKILLLGVFPRHHAGDTPAQIAAPDKINAIISKFADGKMIRYLNINDKFLGPDGKIPTGIMPDYLHPNEHGYQIWHDAMEPTLDEMMK